MKCNIKKAMAAQNVRQMVSTQGTVKRLWELSTLLALSREFGFGKTRLKRFADEMNGIYKEVVDRARLTDKYDKKHRELTDIDTAIINVIRELRRAGIDHREILGDDCHLVVIDENGKEMDLDAVVDKMEGVLGNDT